MTIETVQKRSQRLLDYSDFHQKGAGWAVREDRVL